MPKIVVLRTAPVCISEDEVSVTGHVAAGLRAGGAAVAVLVIVIQSPPLEIVAIRSGVIVGSGRLRCAEVSVHEALAGDIDCAISDRPAFIGEIQRVAALPRFHYINALKKTGDGTAVAKNPKNGIRLARRGLGPNHRHHDQKDYNQFPLFHIFIYFIY